LVALGGRQAGMIHVAKACTAKPSGAAWLEFAA
jgi:hypothetical protein